MISDERAAWQRALDPLGLDPTEEEAYGVLLERGSITANGLATAMQLQRNQAYRLAGHLVRRGLAHRTLERPVQFVAEPLEQVLQRMEVDAALRLSHVHLWRKRIDELPLPQRQRSSSLELIQGRPRAYQEMGRLVNNARSRIEIMDTHPQAGQYLQHAGLLVPLQARAAQGVAVRSILRDVDGLDLPPPVRVVDGTPEHVRWVLRDRQEALMFVETEEGRTFKRAVDRAVCTEAGHVVSMLGWLFDHVWEDASEPASQATSDSH